MLRVPWKDVKKSQKSHGYIMATFDPRYEGFEELYRKRDSGIRSTSHVEALALFGISAYVSHRFRDQPVAAQAIVGEWL